ACGSAGATRKRPGRMLLGNREIHPARLEGEPKHSGVHVLPFSRNLHTPGAGTNRHAPYLFIAAHSSDIQFLCPLAVQETGAGSPECARPALETRNALDSSSAFRGA